MMRTHAKKIKSFTKHIVFHDDVAIIKVGCHGKIRLSGLSGQRKRGLSEREGRERPDRRERHFI
jgi:hypothetical protein